MHRLRSDLLYTLAFGILSGALSAFLFVRPMYDVTYLPELVLQLSGSRGEFALVGGIAEIMNMYMRFAPSILFEIYAGTVMYRSFCTASVYVFTRNPNRAKWYRREACRVLLLSALFTAVSLLVAVLLSAVRHEVIPNVPGAILLLYHFILYSIWTFTVTILINVLSIGLGSYNATLAAAVLQAVCIALLGLVRLSDQPVFAVLTRVSPISHLVLGWFRSAIPSVEEAIPPVIREGFWGFSFPTSLLVVSVYCLAVVLSGRQLVLHHDILSGNAELDGG